MKKIIELLIKGIGAALSFFAIFGMAFDIFNGGKYILEDWSYTRMVIGAIIVGIGFSVPGLIYENTKLPYIIKFLIHMGIGCTILLVVGFVVGWIPKINKVAASIVIFLEIATAIILWICFSWYYKKMAKKMNEKIKKINDNN